MSVNLKDQSTLILTMDEKLRQNLARLLQIRCVFPSGSSDADLVARCMLEDFDGSKQHQFETTTEDVVAKVIKMSSFHRRKVRYRFIFV